MEYLHVLINGIDNVKQYMSDKEYLTLMNSISKLNEIITSNELVDSDDSDDLDDSVYSVDSVDSIDSVDNYSNDDNIDILDIDLLLETINDNETVFNNYMIENNLPDDFRSSKFNVIYSSAYNYVSNKRCKCQNEYDLCDYFLINFINCKNYQRLILKCPIIQETIVNFENIESNNSVFDDINKYNLFQFDAKINKLNNIDEKIFSSVLKLLLNLMNECENYPKYQVILFITMYCYMFKYGGKLLQHPTLVECSYNKLISESEGMSMKTYLPSWAAKFNFDPNILNIMVDSYKEIIN
jgi:hypothetical protein